MEGVTADTKVLHEILAREGAHQLRHWGINE
jgi:hypothetical protein